jgi:hypothetical protein
MVTGVDGLEPHAVARLDGSEERMRDSVAGRRVA